MTETVCVIAIRKNGQTEVCATGTERDRPRRVTETVALLRAIGTNVNSVVRLKAWKMWKDRP